MFIQQYWGEFQTEFLTNHQNCDKNEAERELYSQNCAERYFRTESKMSNQVCERGRKGQG